MKEWIHPVSLQILFELRNKQMSINALSRRIVSKRGRPTYETVRTLVNSLVKTGVLTERTEGRKRLISVSRENLIARNLLALSEVIRFADTVSSADRRLAKSAQALVELVEENFPDVKVDVYFYGSFAEGHAKSTSDVDVIMVAPSDKIDDLKEKTGKLEKVHVEVVDRLTFSAMETRGEPTVVSALADGIHLQLPFFKHRRPLKS